MRKRSVGGGGVHAGTRQSKSTRATGAGSHVLACVVGGLALLLTACSIDSAGFNAPTVSGIDGGVGGSGAVGGSGGASGAPGAGGIAATGGRAGTGGAVPGGGGTTGTGGMTGAGGVTGTGGRDAGTADVPGMDVPNGQPLGNGALCSAGNACASGHCVDGVCCEQACTSDCMACAADKTGALDGQCRAIKLGTDPDSECEEDTSDACGRTGRCAMGACEVAASGKICAEAACTGYTFAAASRCDGAGTCVASPDDTCPGMLKCANARTCATECTTDNDCRTGTVCDTADGTCKIGIAVGMICNPALGGKDCESGNCVDGVCCDATCVGACRACTLAKTGQRNGHCAPIKANTDPDEECATQDPTSCGRTGMCDGAGACKRYPDGTTCGTTCCQTNQGPNRGARPCNYICRNGACDTATPQPGSETCAGFTCCCPSGGGAGKAACTLPGTCAGQCN